jgi:hypothetical protein
MTNAPIIFIPRAELASAENLRAFIDACRVSPELGARDQFEQNTWATGKTRKGKTTVDRLIFSTREAAIGKQDAPSMQEPFLSFAKAMLVYLESHRPVVSSAIRLAALRCIDAALFQCGKGARPTALNPVALDCAVDLAKEQFGDAAAYRTAGQIQLIADTMQDLLLVPSGPRWTHDVHKPAERNSRIEKVALEAREKALPSAAALRALGKLFRVAEGTCDVLISSVAALMVCAPQRVNEVVRLGHRCLIEEDDGDGISIRWPGSKGYYDHTKPISPAVADVARDAIARIVQCTGVARSIAKWYEDNPNKLYLHARAEHLRHREKLTVQELGLVLFGQGAKNGSVRAWCDGHEVEFVDTGRTIVRYADAERAVISMLPASFPHTSIDGGGLYSEALFVIRKNELNAQRGTYECVVDVVAQDDIAVRLGQRSTTGIKSVFERYGFTEDDGSPIILRTHQFRHYLNHIAQLGGLSQAEVAMFSGRKDVRQNDAYNHMTADEAQEPIARALVEHDFMGHLAQVAQKQPMLRSDFLRSGPLAVHATDFGYCVHNFASEPCQLYRNCLQCEELVCLKGERHKLANIEKAREEKLELLRVAEAAMREGSFNAETWVRLYQDDLAHLDARLKLLRDPAVPDGAAIQSGRVVPWTELGVPPVARAVPRAAGAESAEQLPHTTERLALAELDE